MRVQIFRSSSQRLVRPLDVFSCLFFSVFAHMLTSVDGPLLEETGVLLQVPAVTGCMLPWNGEGVLFLEDTEQA